MMMTLTQALWDPIEKYWALKKIMFNMHNATVFPRKLHINPENPKAVDEQSQPKCYVNIDGEQIMVMETFEEIQEWARVREDRLYGR
jgi:hypothetical protein